MDSPKRGEIWLVDLNPTRGREVRGPRPGLIISTDRFNQGPTGLVVVLPLTTKRKNTPLHVEIQPPEGGVREVSFIKTEDIRSISKERLQERWGEVTAETLMGVEDCLRILLEI